MVLLYLILAFLYWGGEAVLDSTSFMDVSLFFFAKLDRLAILEYMCTCKVSPRVRVRHEAMVHLTRMDF